MIALPTAMLAGEMVATAVNGHQADQRSLVTYTNGTSTRFTQSLSDWCLPQNLQESRGARPWRIGSDRLARPMRRPVDLDEAFLSTDGAKTVKKHHVCRIIAMWCVLAA